MVSPVSREKAGLLGSVRSVRTDVTQFVRERGRLIEKPWYHSTVRYRRDRQSHRAIDPQSQRHGGASHIRVRSSGAHHPVGQ